MTRHMLMEAGFLLAAVAAALLARTYLVAVYAIPSESMLPGLTRGDYLLVDKWPFARPTPRLPARGEVVVFRAPPSGRRSYVKRVIGLPGDTVALRGGVLAINGRRVPRWRVADWHVPRTPNLACTPGDDGWPRQEAEGSRTFCRAPRFRELLPGGALVDTLDLGTSGGDDYGPVTVPAGALFVLGDDRDRSADSRWPAQEGGAVGMVPRANLIGRARVVLFALDGSAHGGSPASWWRSVRWERIGLGF